jgi:Tfp pilus assembly protein PilV
LITALITLIIITAVALGIAGYFHWRLRNMTSAYQLVHQALTQVYRRNRRSPAALDDIEPGLYRTRNGNRR